MLNLVTFHNPTVFGFKKSAGGVTVTLESGRPYLFAHTQMQNIMKDTKVQANTYKLSLASPRIPNFHIAALKKNQRVLIYNASGGYGDQILTWPLAKYLADHGAQVHILTDPGNNTCWWGFPWVRSVNTVPMLWEQAKLFDHFLLYESVVNMDEHQDQEHPLDAMFRRIGVDPDSVSAAQKVVRPVFAPAELGTLSKYKCQGQRVGIYQLTSANPVRGLPANDSVWMILKLAEETPDMHWLCLYDEFVPAEYKETLESEASKRGIKNVEAFCALNLRELWALTEYVSVVVAPDSMMVHVAGIFGTPCVGLWGPMSPESRVLYYQNHHPIYHKAFCQFSPCFVYSNIFPRYCPNRPPSRTVCDVLASISPDEVAELVKKVAR